MTGEELRKARLRQRFTQQKLGEKLGYQGKTASRIIQAYEYDKREIALKHIRKLSELLEVPIDKFIP